VDTAAKPPGDFSPLARAAAVAPGGPLRVESRAVVLLGAR
jgi:hypothetical protein